MDSELVGWLLGVVVVGVQAVFIYVLSKILSVFTDRILPDKKD